MNLEEMWSDYTVIRSNARNGERRLSYGFGSWSSFWRHSNNGRAIYLRMRIRADRRRNEVSKNTSMYDISMLN